MKMWDKFRSNRYKYYVEVEAGVSATKLGEDGPWEVHLRFESETDKQLPVIMSQEEAADLATKLLNASRNNI